MLRPKSHYNYPNPIMFKQIESITDIEVTVLFRQWKHSDAALAIFPLIPSSTTSGECMAYDATQGWGSVDFAVIVDETVDASYDEYRKCKEKVERTGKRLNVMSMYTFMDRERDRARKSCTWNLDLIKSC